MTGTRRDFLASTAAVGATAALARETDVLSPEERALIACFRACGPDAGFIVLRGEPDLSARLRAAGVSAETEAEIRAELREGFAADLEAM